MSWERAFYMSKQKELGSHGFRGKGEEAKCG